MSHIYFVLNVRGYEYDISKSSVYSGALLRNKTKRYQMAKNLNLDMFQANRFVFKIFRLIIKIYFTF